jgi:4-nitrophenyl phosphatase
MLLCSGLFSNQDELVCSLRGWFKPTNKQTIQHPLISMPSMKIDLSKIRALILDMDGVLWRHKTPIGDLAAIFNQINTMGLQVMMATNNSTNNPANYVLKLAGFSVSVAQEQIVNSGWATAQYLRNRFPQSNKVYIVGDQPLVDLMASFGFENSSENPSAVVAALDRGITYEKLTTANLLIRAGIPFIGTNPDRSFPIPGGQQAPGAGAILAALEAGSGIAPTIIGKPQPAMYRAALERLGTTPEETLVVGDRLETDILGAQKTGCPSALVLSGVATREQAEEWSPRPEIIAKNLESVVELIREA